MLGRITRRAVPEQGGLGTGEQGGRQSTRGPALRPRHREGVHGEGTKVERAAKGRKGRGKHPLGELPVRVTQRCKHVATGVPKWVFRSWNVSWGPSGSDLQRQRPSSRQEGPCGQLNREANGGATRLTDPSLARSVTRPWGRVSLAWRKRSFSLCGHKHQALRVCTHPQVRPPHRQPGSPASTRLGLSAPPGIRTSLTQRAPARLGIGAGFIAPEDSSRTSAFRQASAPSPSPPAGGERRL